MINGHFEWNDEKAAVNLIKHGVSFEDAVLVFSDPLGVDRKDDREVYGEIRMSLIGLSAGTMLHVTYTERDDTIRIISARQAERQEQDDYDRKTWS